MRKCSGNQIKFFMAALMVLDHIPHIPGLVPPLWQGIFHALTRCVSMWFAYTAVEGFQYTHSRLHYDLRLLGWGIFMALGNWGVGQLFASKGIHVSNNIFLTLAAGVFLLNVLASPVGFLQSWKPWAQNLVRWVVAAPVLLLGMFLTEGGIVVLPFMLITYFCRNNPKLRNGLYLIFAAFLASSLPGIVGMYDDWATRIDMLLFNSDWLFITVIPFLYLYSGERGKKTPFTKYFFYVFYPAHLWIIAAISYFVA